MPISRNQERLLKLLLPVLALTISFSLVYDAGITHKGRIQFMEPAGYLIILNGLLTLLAGVAFAADGWRGRQGIRFALLSCAIYVPLVSLQIFFGYLVTMGLGNQ